MQTINLTPLPLCFNFSLILFVCLFVLGNECTGLERKAEQTNISLAEAQGAFYILGLGMWILTTVNLLI